MTSSNESRGWANPVRVVRGRGLLGHLPSLVGERSVFLVTSSGSTRRGLTARIREQLGPLLTGVHEVERSNPTVADCTGAMAQAALHDAAMIVAVGGGSVLDTAKAVAAGGHVGAEGRLSPAWLSDRLRQGAPFPDGFAPTPLIAVPTTAGTGSEVTMWGTIWDEASGRKYSLAHPGLYPEAAIVDPTLTLSVPEDTTVFTALDTLSHAMEAVWNRSANPVSDALASWAIHVVSAELPGLAADRSDLGRREKIQDACLLAGLAFSNTRTALAHSISYPLTAALGMPHGLACGFTLGEILALNGAAEPERGLQVAAALGCDSVEAAVDAIYALFAAVGLAGRMAQYVGSKAAFAAVPDGFINPERAGNNVAAVDEPTARELMLRAWSRIAT